MVNEEKKLSTVLEEQTVFLLYPAVLTDLLKLAPSL